MKAEEKAKKNAEALDWLRQVASAANPEQFTAAFIAGALSVLKKAGLPATQEELRVKTHFVRPDSESHSSVAHDIAHDANLLVLWESASSVAHDIAHNAKLPEQVRLAPDVVFRAEQVLYWIEKNNTRSAVAETARLFGIVWQSLDLDAEPYIKAGKAKIAQLQKIADKKKQDANRRAKLLAPVWVEVVASMPDATDFERNMEAAAILHQRHPDVWRKPPGEQTIRDLLQRLSSGSKALPGVADSV